uniref:Ribosomal protein S20 n=1 Tax=Kumanoa americana TaxID=1196377 RepID=A0A1C9CGG8_9FLOR|nr:ribosomal protein S20 [Kumanoa americana]AOM67471.1 ribosomal protein S20 [Kumanoa americana]
MPKKISVVKRVIIAERNHRRNKTYKSMIKTLTKKYLTSISTTEQEKELKYLKFSLNNLYSKIDKAVKKGVFHPNNGARKKSSLSKALKNINI